MDPEILAAIDQVVSAANAKLAEAAMRSEDEKAQIRKAAHLELLTALKSRLGV
jgi:hypothetical protein